MRKPFLCFATLISLSACQPQAKRSSEGLTDRPVGVLAQDLNDTSKNPFSSDQWGLSNQGNPQNIEFDQVTTYRVQARSGEDIHIPEGLKSPQKKILVAVLDTGIDFDHPDLKNVIHRNEPECRALEKFNACLAEKGRAECEKIWMDLNNPEVDQDHNGYPLDCHGWSILGTKNAVGILGRPDFSDDQGHGTHVAGIIAAERNNGIGVSGVSSNIEILPVQVIGKKPSEPIKPLSVDISPGEAGKEEFRNNLGDLIARGVNYAIHSGAQVISLSLGWTEAEDSKYLRDVIAEAQRRGIIVVAAAGNDSTRALLRPCSYPGVICVASHGPDGSLSHFSNYGSGVTIAAPGTNILSTFPMNMRPIRFRKTPGYDYLNGTSQATPFVTGIVAEMLAQGIPRVEILPRLILGARPLKEKLPLLKGAATELREDPSQEDPRVEKKWILSGLADLGASLKVQPQALIVPANKEKQILNWDLKSRTLTLKFNFQNLWKDIPANQVSVQGSFLKPNAQAIRPLIQSLAFEKGTQGIWKSGEIRTLVAQVLINDSQDPSQSRIPSDLDLSVQVSMGSQTRSYVLETEILVPVTSQTQKSVSVESLPLLKMPAMRTSLVAFDQNLDGSAQTDYYALGVQNQSNQYFLLRQNTRGAYEASQPLKVNLAGEDMDGVREVITARLNWNGSESGYILGLLIDRTKADKDSSLKIHYLSGDFKLQKSLEITNAMVKIPLRVSWMQSDGVKVPAWVGLGKDPDKKASVINDWENPDNREQPLIRFYYMDQAGKYHATTSYQDYYFLDTLSPTLDQIKAGRVPVILGKNHGTENKPSYIYDFAIAEMVNGQIENFQILNRDMGQEIYRNLLDTKVDTVLSLRSPLNFGQGTFWFGEGISKEQRISSLIRTDQGLRFYESNIKALRGTVDAALLVRAVFSGPDSFGAFVMTNSELQYHDLKRNQIVDRSLERYTFIPDKAFTNLHFPIVVRDQKNSQWGLPGLLTTEGSGISRGVKIKLAVRDSNQNLVEIAAPAKLRFQAGEGCRPLDNPTLSSDGTSAMDYYCGDHLLRMKLEY